jgi:signal transduction histidine kinase
MPALKLLIVDDDEVDRMTVRRALRQAAVDATIDECSDARTALAAIQEAAYDCVLLDYRLPGSDGLQMLSAIRGAGITVPVVVLTGQGDEETAVTLMKAGAADYVNKNGLAPERLERSLRYALALHRGEEERRLLLAREQQARAEAQAANRAKDEFLATLSHELRTPLNAILGWAKLLAGGYLDEPTTKRALEIIERNTRVQAQLIEDLLDISRVITGKLRLECRMVPIRSLIDGALDSVRYAADAKRIAIDIDTGSGENTLWCDPARMQQVIWNLLSNAIKFTPEDGEVRIRLEQEGNRLAISVTDTGSGIDPAFLPFVFDRFRQQDGAPTRRHGGLGLGLSIVRHIVELHGGAVSASSEGEGQGATFVVRVPVAAPMPADGHTHLDAFAIPDIDDPPDLNGVTVLVVENELDARSLVSAVLERCGARVVMASGAEDALEQLERELPAILLSDLALPDDEGYTLIRRIRARADDLRSIPAAALTAFATPADRARALFAGYQAHIPKPLEPTELAAVVAALAGRSVVRN